MGLIFLNWMILVVLQGFRSVSAFSLLQSRSVPMKKTNIVGCKSDSENEEPDTIRVRLWRALATGEELSLKELGKIVGERRRGELQSHLKHVEKQAETLRNKSTAWRNRRGLDENVSKVRLIRSKGRKNVVYIQLKLS